MLIYTKWRWTRSWKSVKKIKNNNLTLNFLTGWLAVN